MYKFWSEHLNKRSKLGDEKGELLPRHLNNRVLCSDSDSIRFTSHKTTPNTIKCVYVLWFIFSFSLATINLHFFLPCPVPTMMPHENKTSAWAQATAVFTFSNSHTLTRNKIVIIFSISLFISLATDTKLFSNLPSKSTSSYFNS